MSWRNYLSLGRLAFQGEESNLFGVPFDKPVELFPLERLVERLGRCPIFLELLIRKIPYFVFDRLYYLRSDQVTNSLLVRRLDIFVIEGTEIASYSDAINACWNYTKAFLGELRDTRRGINIPWSQEAVSEVSTEGVY